MIQKDNKVLPSWQAEQSTSRSSHKTPSALWLKWNFCVQRYHQHHQWSVQKENRMLPHVHLTCMGKLYTQWYRGCLWQIREQRKTLKNTAKDTKISVSSSKATFITLTVQKCTKRPRLRSTQHNQATAWIMNPSVCCVSQKQGPRMRFLVVYTRSWH